MYSHRLFKYKSMYIISHFLTMLLFLTSPLQRLLRGKMSNGTSFPMGRGNATNCVKTAPTRHWKANPWMGTWNSGTPSQQLRQCNLRGKMSNGTSTPMVRGNDTNCVKIVTTRHWRTNPWMGTLNSGIPSQQLRQCNVEQRRTKNSSTTLMNIRLVLLCFLFRSKRNLLWFYSVFFFLFQNTEKVDGLFLNDESTGSQVRKQFDVEECRVSLRGIHSSPARGS